MADVNPDEYTQRSAQGGPCFYADQLETLRGYKMEGVAMDDRRYNTDFETFFGLVMKKGKSRKVLWFHDYDGNGPGSFEITEV